MPPPIKNSTRDRAPSSENAQRTHQAAERLRTESTRGVQSYQKIIQMKKDALNIRLEPTKDALPNNTQHEALLRSTVPGNGARPKTSTTTSMIRAFGSLNLNSASKPSKSPLQPVSNATAERLEQVYRDNRGDRNPSPERQKKGE